MKFICRRAIHKICKIYLRKCDALILRKRTHHLISVWVAGSSRQSDCGNLRIDDVSPWIEDEHEYAIDENNTSDDIDDVLLGGTEKSASGGRNYVSYVSVENVRCDHERRLPLSVLRLKTTGEFVCIIQKTTIIQILPAVWDDIAGVDEHGSGDNFFVGHYLKGLSGCWAILKRKSVIFASYCQSLTILGSQHQLFARPRRVADSRSTFNTLRLTQNGMYCITMTVVGLCVPPISLVHAMKVMGINRKRRHHHHSLFLVSSAL
jgi:hypothetical protein